MRISSPQRGSASSSLDTSAIARIGWSVLPTAASTFALTAMPPSCRAATNSPCFEAKCLYSIGSEQPAAAAISAVDAPW